jgi:carbamoyl-phosphate synthase large subunit
MLDKSSSVLITGVGGGVGQSILKSLQGSEYRVVVMDSSSYGAGLYAAENSYLGLDAKHENYIDRVLEICHRENCKLVFPGHDVELSPLAIHRKRFEAMGTQLIISAIDVINLCDDKLETANFLTSNGFCAPKTFDLKDYTWMGFPVILKPRRGGARSKRTYFVETSDQFVQIQNFIDRENCVVQEFIDGDEFTAGSINFDGGCLGVIVMRRILRDGDTYKAFVIRDTVIESEIIKVLNLLKPFGACNVQFRIRDGEIYIFEINARCSGTTAARSLAGFNEPLMIADYLIKKQNPNFKINEISILRYWKELVVDNSHISQVALQSECHISEMKAL